MSTVLTCPSCGQNNRIPGDASGKTVVCGKCKTPLTAGSGGGVPVELSDQNFAASVGQGKWVVDFWAAWCGPCRMIAPTINELAAERHDIRFGKLDTDQHRRTSEQYRVQGIPLLVFIENGVEKGRITGAHPKRNIEAAIQQYLT
jgi:thioredoxin 2